MKNQYLYKEIHTSYPISKQWIHKEGKLIEAFPLYVILDNINR